MNNRVSENQRKLITLVNADAEKQGKVLRVEQFVGGQRLDLWQSAEGTLGIEGHRDEEIVVSNQEESRAMALHYPWGSLPSARLVMEDDPRKPQTEAIEILSCSDYQYAFSEERNAGVYWWDVVSPRVRIRIEGTFSPEVKEFVEQFNPTSWEKPCGSLSR